MGVEVGSPETAVGGPDPDLIVDGLIGYSLKGAARSTAGELIRWADAQDSPVLALDATSGVDATTGTVFDPAVPAAATMTLALPKEGLRATGVEARVGELYLADIGVPPSLYAGPALGLKVGNIFSEAVGTESKLARYPPCQACSGPDPVVRTTTAQLGPLEDLQIGPP